MSDQLKKLTFKYWCNIFNEDELHIWMNFEMENNPSPHLDMYDLNANEPYEVAKILLKIAKDRYGFSPNSREGVEISKDIIVEVGENYLKRVGPLTDLCNLLGTLGSTDLSRNEQLLYLGKSDPKEILWKLYWEVHDDYNPTNVWSLENDSETRMQFEIVLSNFKKEKSLKSPT